MWIIEAHGAVYLSGDGCNAVERILQPTNTFSFVRILPQGLPSGTYRFRFVGFRDLDVLLQEQNPLPASRLVSLTFLVN
jgi:hypothetical protein